MSDYLSPAEINKYIFEAARNKDNVFNTFKTLCESQRINLDYVDFEYKYFQYYHGNEDLTIEKRPENSSTVTFDDLPREMVDEIVSKLNLIDRLKSRKVCSKMLYANPQMSQKIGVLAVQVGEDFIDLIFDEREVSYEKTKDGVCIVKIPEESKVTLPEDYAKKAIDDFEIVLKIPKIQIELIDIFIEEFSVSDAVIQLLKRNFSSRVLHVEKAYIEIKSHEKAVEYLAMLKPKVLKEFQAEINGYIEHGDISELVSMEQFKQAKVMNILYLAVIDANLIFKHFRHFQDFQVQVHSMSVAQILRLRKMIITEFHSTQFTECFIEIAKGLRLAHFKSIRRALGMTEDEKLEMVHRYTIPDTNGAFFEFEIYPHSVCWKPGNSAESSELNNSDDDTEDSEDSEDVVEEKEDSEDKKPYMAHVVEVSEDVKKDSESSEDVDTRSVVTNVMQGEVDLENFEVLSVVIRHYKLSARSKIPDLHLYFQTTIQETQSEISRIQNYRKELAEKGSSLTEKEKNLDEKLKLDVLIHEKKIETCEALILRTKDILKAEEYCKTNGIEGYRFEDDVFLQNLAIQGYEDVVSKCKADLSKFKKNFFPYLDGLHNLHDSLPSEVSDLNKALTMLSESTRFFEKLPEICDDFLETWKEKREAILKKIHSGDTTEYKFSDSEDDKVPGVVGGSEFKNQDSLAPDDVKSVEPPKTVSKKVETFDSSQIDSEDVKTPDVTFSLNSPKLVSADVNIQETSFFESSDDLLTPKDSENLKTQEKAVPSNPDTTDYVGYYGPGEFDEFMRRRHIQNPQTTFPVKKFLMLFGGGTVFFFGMYLVFVVTFWMGSIF